jgi:hypothetical protein
MVGHLMEREPYWDYMGRRMKEERSVSEDIYKSEISQMQKEIHFLQMRVKELTEEVYDLRKHGPVQLELDI